MSEDILKDKKILAVDDEPDILQIIEDLLVDCKLVLVRDYESAKKLIETEKFDLAILDIMGVNGFALLEACWDRRIPATMLTAHALTADSVNRALRLGAVSFLPKEELANLPELLEEIFQQLAQGKSHWERLFNRLGPFFRDRVGLIWEDLEKPRYPPYLY